MEEVVRFVSEGTHEVEARLGWVLPTGRFEPDIGVEKFTALLSHCSAQGWTKHPQTSSTDYFFDDGVRVTKGLDGQEVESVRKTKLFDQTSSERGTSPVLGYRVSVSDEHPISFGCDGSANRVRRKTRQSFTVGALRYDFTVVVDNGDTAYLVEVEVVEATRGAARSMYEAIAQLLNLIKQ